MCSVRKMSQIQRGLANFFSHSSHSVRTSAARIPQSAAIRLLCSYLCMPTFFFTGLRPTDIGEPCRSWRPSDEVDRELYWPGFSTTGCRASSITRWPSALVRGNEAYGADVVALCREPTEFAGLAGMPTCSYSREAMRPEDMSSDITAAFAVWHTQQLECEMEE